MKLFGKKFSFLNGGLNLLGKSTLSTVASSDISSPSPSLSIQSENNIINKNLPDFHLKSQGNLICRIIQQPFKNLPLINQLLSKLEKDYPPSTELYNILLRAQILMGNKDKVDYYLALFSKNNIKFNSQTWNLRIFFAKNTNNMILAEKLFNELYFLCKKNNDTESLNINNKEMESEQKQEMEMEIKSDKEIKDFSKGPDVPIFTTMISGWASLGNIKKCQELFEMAKSLHSDKLDIKFYSAMIMAYLNKEMISDANNLCVQMVEGKLEPNHVIWKMFLFQLLKNNHHGEAIKVYEEHLRMICSNSLDFLDILRHFLRANLIEMAFQVIQDLKYYTRENEEFEKKILQRSIMELFKYFTRKGESYYSNFMIHYVWNQMVMREPMAFCNDSLIQMITDHANKHGDYQKILNDIIKIKSNFPSIFSLSN